AAVRGQAAVHDRAEIAVATGANVLEHADGHETIVRAGDVAVVILDELDPIGQAFASRLLAAVGDLFMGDVEGADAHPVLARHVERQRSPAATRLDDALTRTQCDLAADVIHL